MAKCSWACWNSQEPPGTCICVCGGASHGKGGEIVPAADENGLIIADTRPPAMRLAATLPPHQRAEHEHRLALMDEGIAASKHAHDSWNRLEDAQNAADTLRKLADDATEPDEPEDRRAAARERMSEEIERLTLASARAQDSAERAVLAADPGQRQALDTAIQASRRQAGAPDMSLMWAGEIDGGRVEVTAQRDRWHIAAQKTGGSIHSTGILLERALAGAGCTNAAGHAQQIVADINHGVEPPRRQRSGPPAGRPGGLLGSPAWPTRPSPASTAARPPTSSRRSP